MKINKLDNAGFYLEDHVQGDLPSNWTKDLVGNGYYKAQYQGATINPETGEFTGGSWVETGGPSPEDIAAAHQILVNAANAEKTSLISDTSNMIATLTDEIEGLEDAGDNVPDKLRNDLKAWKQYRVKVKNVDTSLAPNIEWPIAPPMLRATE